MGPEQLLRLAYVADRYYTDNRSRVEIADELGVSRFKVARMLEEEHDVGDRAARDRGCERALQLPGLLVAGGAEVHQVRAAGHESTLDARQASTNGRR